MHLLVTAGGTIVPIDRVRFIGNGFTGRTGARIALAAHRRGHHVTLLTSHPDAVAGIAREAVPTDERWRLLRYHTFDDLHKAMAERLKSPGVDAVIHSAAVSDYRSAGVFAPAQSTRFDDTKNEWYAADRPKLVDRELPKVKSDEPELWLRLVKTPKLIDLVRDEWRFGGVLVKFKLEIDVTETQLLEVAERSRLHSKADLMVANTVEGMGTCAYLGPLAGRYERIARPDLPERLLDAVEECRRKGHHG